MYCVAWVPIDLINLVYLYLLIKPYLCVQVRLDGWINLDMDKTAASKIVGLRPCLEDLIVRGSADPESISEPGNSDEQVCLVYVMCYQYIT